MTFTCLLSLSCILKRNRQGLKLNIKGEGFLCYVNDVINVMQVFT